MSVLYVVDLDGTIAHIGELVKDAGPEPSRADKDAYRAWLDKMVSTETLLKLKPVVGMVGLTRNLPNYPMYLTSREETWREVTEYWLARKGFPKRYLVMRPNGDWRSSSDFKESEIKQRLLFYPAFTSVLLLDDDADGSLEEVCKRNGWTLLKAVSGGNPSKL